MPLTPPTAPDRHPLRSPARRISGLLAPVVLSAAFAAIAVSSPADAIVGGGAVSPAIYPFQVTVIADDSLCSGTVIGVDRVLTAAHCVDDTTGAAARLGDGRLPYVDYIAVHPLWNGDVNDGHDLAVLTLHPGYGDQVPAVQVGAPWNPEFYAAGRSATLVGNGDTYAGAPGLSTGGELRAVNTIVRSDSDMDDLYNPWYGFDHWNETLMIGGGTTTQTVCHGDSGGSLLTDANGSWHWVQLGVTSFTNEDHECAEPGAFSELAGPQLAWVASQVPSIMDGWGACHTATGAVGRTVTQYVPWALSYAQGHVGPYDWQIRCDSLTPSPPPPPPPPPPCRFNRCQEQQRTRPGAPPA